MAQILKWFMKAKKSYQNICIRLGGEKDVLDVHNWFDQSEYDYFIYVGDVNFEEGKFILDAIPSNLALDPYARLVMRHVRMILL